MGTAVQTVSNNIKALRDNSTPRVSQKRIGEAIGVRQPQVSLRLSGSQPWGLDELDQIAQLFRVPLTLLVDPDPGAVYRWLAEHGRIEVPDQDVTRSTCNHPYGSYVPRLFDPDEPGFVIDLRDHIVTQSTGKEPLALYANAS